MSLQAGSENSHLNQPFKLKYFLRSTYGILAMGLSVFIYYMATEQYKVMTEQLKAFQDIPFDGPPWYSIHSAFLLGICYGVALLVTLLLALAIVRWFPETSLVLAIFGPIWLVGRVWESAVIMASCTNLMDSDKATTRWHTFDEFLYDPFILFGNFILPFLWPLLFYPISPILKRLDYRQRNTKVQSNAVPSLSPL